MQQQQNFSILRPPCQQYITHPGHPTQRREPLEFIRQSLQQNSKLNVKQWAL